MEVWRCTLIGVKKVYGRWFSVGIINGFPWNSYSLAKKTIRSDMMDLNLISANVHLGNSRQHKRHLSKTGFKAYIQSQTFTSYRVKACTICFKNLKCLVSVIVWLIYTCWNQPANYHRLIWTCLACIYPKAGFVTTWLVCNVRLEKIVLLAHFSFSSCWWQK